MGTSEAGPPAGEPSGKSDAADESQSQTYQQLAALDNQLVQLLSQRAEAFVKLISDTAFSLNPNAQRDALVKAIQQNSGPLADGCVEAIFRELQSGCRALIRATRVAYLGPPHSYSHLAALSHFGQSVEYLPVQDIAAVFESIDRAQADYGIVPLENSTDGRIVDTLGMFVRKPAQICGEIELEIHHFLLGNCSRSEVTDVYSKPQALSQCRDWLGKNLPNAELHEVSSTAAAAKIASDNHGAAAVASEQAGVANGLGVIDPCIEDNPDNVTRFAVIGEEELPSSGSDKTALMMEMAHKPGALADVMAVFKQAKINLTWIESFPMPGTTSEYLFFVELEGHRQDAQVIDALATLKHSTRKLDVLGSFPRRR